MLTICSKCRGDLRFGRDTTKSGSYRKNCQRCRDKRTSSNRRKRGRSPVHRSSPFPKYTPGPSRVPNTPSSMVFGTSLETSGPLPRRKYASHISANRRTSTFIADNSEARGPECSVCGDTFLMSRFPSLQRCTHEPCVCQGCFSDWLTSQVGSTSWDRIVCPSTGCGALINHEEMKQLASAETYTR
jgi:hypothetical protein